MAYWSQRHKPVLSDTPVGIISECWGLSVQSGLCTRYPPFQNLLLGKNWNSIYNKYTWPVIIQNPVCPLSNIFIKKKYVLNGTSWENLGIMGYFFFLLLTFLAFIPFVFEGTGEETMLASELMSLRSFLFCLRVEQTWKSWVPNWQSKSNPCLCISVSCNHAVC